MRPHDARPVLLVIHPGSLGDILLALEAIRALRCAWPSHDLFLLARRDVGALLKACEEVHEALPIEGRTLAQLLAGPDRLDRGLTAWLDRCAVAVCWMNDPGSLESTLRQAGVRQVIVRSPHSPTLQAIHTADRYVEILKPWGIRRDDGQALLMPRENFHPTSAFPAAGSPATIAVHPGSGSSVKCYDAHRLATVIRLLQSRYNPRFLVLSGPADEAATTRLLDQVPGVEASVIRDTGLTTVAGILAKVQVFIGQDSGITHLVAALGVPTIALFGPTDPERWAPQGRRVLVLRGSPCMCVGSEQVRCCQFRPCLEIPVEHIVHAVERYLLNQPDHARLPWSERVC